MNIENETRQKVAKKCSLQRVNEHFEPLFNAVSAKRSTFATAILRRGGCQQAQLGAGAEKIKKMPIHEKAKALTFNIVPKLVQSQWPDLSDIGLTRLLSAEFQNSQLMVDLTAVFKAIQEGNMIQFVIAPTMVADQGNQAAADTFKTCMLGAIIPDPAMNGHTESADMHLLMGLQPVHVNQHNLMNVLIATIKVFNENQHNADLTLHFFLDPQFNIQDYKDPLSSVSNIENSINPDLPVSGFDTFKAL